MQLSERSVHLCVDMQRLFTDDGPWPTPWVPRVLPIIQEIAGRFPERTVFTLLPPLARLAPPAIVLDKTRYSAFVDSPLHRHLIDRRADGLLITGSETDVCVLSTVLSAVDLGYPVTLITDAVCSSSDEGHDALLKVYQGRFSQQIETASAEEILRQWR